MRQRTLRVAIEALTACRGYGRHIQAKSGTAEPVCWNFTGSTVEVPVVEGEDAEIVLFTQDITGLHDAGCKLTLPAVALGQTGKAKSDSGAYTWVVVEAPFDRKAAIRDLCREARAMLEGMPDDELAHFHQIGMGRVARLPTSPPSPSTAPLVNSTAMPETEEDRNHPNRPTANPADVTNQGQIPTGAGQASQHTS